MVTNETRIRQLPLGETGGTTYSAGTPTQNLAPISGKQKTVSSGHPFQQLGRGRKTFDERHDQADIGGDFYTQKDFYVPHNVPLIDVRTAAVWTNGEPLQRQRGLIAPTTPNFSATRLAAAPSSNVNLDKFGTDAISKVYPTKPESDMAIAVAELLREGIPKLIGSSLLKSRLKDFRKVGDEYLNYQFGWMPFLNDIKSAVDATVNAEKILTQLRRDSGRNVRRRFNEPIVKTVTDQVVGDSWPVGLPSNGNLVTTGGTFRKITRSIVTTRKRSFSGCFTYHLEMGNGELETLTRLAQEMKKLYGIRIDPDVLWNLTPWSWAADWFGNLGNIITNISAFSEDGLVMRYGYVMEETSVAYTDIMWDVRLRGYPSMNLSHSYGTTTKVRRRATPYGFGLNLGSLSDYQWGIIGALGISRVPKGLHK